MQRAGVCLFLMAAAASAQQSRQYASYTFDVNGQRTGGRSATEVATPESSRQTVKIRSVNGRNVPVETVEERVLREGPEGKVVETLIRRFDQNGQPTQRERVQREERREGARTVTTTTVWREDLNGNYAIAERTRTEAATSGETTRARTIIERPTLDGAVAAVERRVETETRRDGRSSRDVDIYRRDQGGSFRPAARESAEIVEQNGRRVETATRYNTANDTGRMQFAGQTVTETIRREDGLGSTVISVFGAASPGRPIESGRKPHLREQVLIERRPGLQGSLIETTMVRRTSLSDATKLEEPQLVSETVCTGDCIEPVEASPAQP